MHGGGTDRPTAGPSDRRGWIVMIGLLFTLVGAFAISLFAPSGGAAFPGLVGDFAVGLVGLWLGGILLGYGLGIRTRGGR